MYLILALLFTIAFAVILHRSHRSKSMQALYGPQVGTTCWHTSPDAAKEG